MRQGPSPSIRTRHALAALAALATAGLAAPAYAAIETPSPATACTVPAQPLSPAAAPSLAAAKAGAILGGAPSALDAIRMQQAAVAAPAATLLAGADPGMLTLTPGIGPSAPLSVPCESLVASRAMAIPGSSLTPLVAQPIDPDNFLASKRIRIGHTNFDKDWKRVRGEKLPASAVKRHLGALPASPEASLAAVNRWVNQRIRYAEDRDQYGVGDFWAGAKKTLRAGKGDCEDIALVKMQLLAAAGVPREDMILTIARDLVRNADHAVLIVRTGGGWRMLDNATDEVLDAAPSHDYRAILSFGNQASWLHGV